MSTTSLGGCCCCCVPITLCRCAPISVCCCVFMTICCCVTNAACCCIRNASRCARGTSPSAIHDGDDGDASCCTTSTPYAPCSPTPSPTPSPPGGSEAASARLRAALGGAFWVVFFFGVRFFLMTPLGLVAAGACVVVGEDAEGGVGLTGLLWGGGGVCIIVMKF